MNSEFNRFFEFTWAILFESAGWVMISLLAAGLLHEFLQTGRIRKLLNRPGHTSTLGAVALGGMLPICSCGVIPLAVGLFRSGIRIGPVMAFTAATPIINPAAVILSLALLGTQLTMAYVLLGLILPFILGQLCERYANIADKEIKIDDSCCSSNQAQIPTTSKSIWRRIGIGLRWGLFDLGPTIGFYLSIGIVISGLIHFALPPARMDQYLGGTAVMGLVVAGLLGASIYVCAVAHIPLVATLLAAGAGPGAAIVFLVTGTATNLPELFTLYKTIGRRVVLLYTTTLVIASIIAGVLVNLWLWPGFIVQFDPLANLDKLSFSQCFSLNPEIMLNTVSALLVTTLAAVGFYKRVSNILAKQTDNSCCTSETR